MGDNLRIGSRTWREIAHKWGVHFGGLENAPDLCDDIRAAPVLVPQVAANCSNSTPSPNRCAVQRCVPVGSFGTAAKNQWINRTRNALRSFVYADAFHCLCQRLSSILLLVRLLTISNLRVQNTHFDSRVGFVLMRLFSSERAFANV